MLVRCGLLWILSLLVALPTALAKTAYLYATDNERGGLSIIRTRDNKLVKTIGLDYPVFVAINPASTLAYVSDSYGISVISTSRKSVLGTITGVVAWPSQWGGCPCIVFSPDGRTAYATGNVSGAVFVIHTKTRKVTGQIATQIGSVALAITPGGEYLYVANYTAVSVISTATNQIIATIDLGLEDTIQAWGIAITPDGSTAFVPFYSPLYPHDASGVLVIDLTTKMVVNTIDIPTGIQASATVSPDGRWVYVPGAGIAVIDTSTQTVTNTIPGGGVYVAFTPDGAFAYVGNYGSWGVPEINTATQTLDGGATTGGFYPISVAVAGKK